MYYNILISDDSQDQLLEKMSQQSPKSVMSANDDRQKVDKLREKISEYIRDKEKKCHETHRGRIRLILNSEL